MIVLFWPKYKHTGSESLLVSKQLLIDMKFYLMQYDQLSCEYDATSCVWTWFYRLAQLEYQLACTVLHLPVTLVSHFYILYY